MPHTPSSAIGCRCTTVGYRLRRQARPSAAISVFVACWPGRNLDVRRGSLGKIDLFGVYLLFRLSARQHTLAVEGCGVKSMYQLFMIQAGTNKARAPCHGRSLGSRVFVHGLTKPPRLEQG